MNCLVSKQFDEKLTELGFELRQKCENKDKVVLNQLNISYSEFRLLNLFNFQQYYTVKELAEKLDITSGAITQIVTNLEKKKLVDRKIVPEDRRSIIVHLTQEGKELVKRINKELTSIHEEILSKFREREREILIHTLERYLGAINEWLNEKSLQKAE